ncbi:MAG: hypothetical protein IJ197_05855 [Bacteroidaceae bacterium]|nr:hypothetical protein [Bacteroidaceae bacterium]
MGLLDIFNRTRKPQPPYDMLTDEQRFALYFLLDYFGNQVGGYNYIDASNYLEKAAWYIGLTKRQIAELESQYQDFEKIVAIVRTITNRQALEYMVSNTYNLRILIRDPETRERMIKVYNSLWSRLGFSPNEIYYLIHKYMYRTDI